MRWELAMVANARVAAATVARLKCMVTMFFLMRFVQVFVLVAVRTVVAERMEIMSVICVCF